MMSNQRIAENTVSIGNINTLFSLFYQVKKETRDALQPWGIRNLTDFSQHVQYCSFQAVNPVKVQPPSIPITCRFIRRCYVPPFLRPLHLKYPPIRQGIIGNIPL